MSINFIIGNLWPWLDPFNDNAIRYVLPVLWIMSFSSHNGTYEGTIVTGTVRNDVIIYAMLSRV